jgi:hypothetical protein
MATFAVTKNVVVQNTPYLVRKLTCTGGATSLAYTHGEPNAPDEISSTILTESPTVTTVATVRTSATVLTLDTLGDAADAIEIYLKWYPQARQDGQSITSDNNS